MDQLFEEGFLGLVVLLEGCADFVDEPAESCFLIWRRGAGGEG